MLNSRMKDHYDLWVMAQEFGFDGETLQAAMLRPSYITDANTLVDKYGRQKPSVNWQFIDRRDIGDAVDCALRLPDLGCEAFYVIGHRDAPRHADVEHTKRRLGWSPAHDFSEYPDDAPVQPA